MAEHLRFVDATNGSPYYDSASFAQTEEVKADGISYSYLNELEVIQFGGLQIKVEDGALISKGRTYIQDEPSDGESPKILTLEGTQVGYLRKDMVVVEFDLHNSVAVAKIVKGEEVESIPALPSLEDESSFWQVCLAVVDVDGASITNIEDKRVIGNGRTNPAFTEDISAPNIKVNDDGKLYLNNDESAYLRYESDALNFKSPDCLELNIAYGLMAEVVLDAGVSSIVIDDLDINKDGGVYDIYVSTKSTTRGMYCKINSYTTDYYSLVKYMDHSLTSNGSVNESNFYYHDYEHAILGTYSGLTDAKYHMKIDFVARDYPAIYCKRATVRSGRQNTAEAHCFYRGSIINITQLTFTTDSGYNFGAGTVIRIYKS